MSDRFIRLDTNVNGFSLDAYGDRYLIDNTKVDRLEPWQIQTDFWVALRLYQQTLKAGEQGSQYKPVDVDIIAVVHEWPKTGYQLVMSKSGFTLSHRAVEGSLTPDGEYHWADMPQAWEAFQDYKDASKVPTWRNYE